MASLLFVPYQGEIKGDPGVIVSKHLLFYWILWIYSKEKFCLVHLTK